MASLKRRLGWLLLAMALLGLVAALTAWASMPRFDRLVQESALDVVRPKASEDIVIVTIDQRSLEAIGPWPWRRAIHAEAIRRIAKSNPRCTGLDVLLDGADAKHPWDDLLLADRIRHAGCVVLPMALHLAKGQAQTELLPPSLIASAATGLGHAHLALDRDGVVQGVYQREGFPDRQWPSFSLALAQAGQGLGVSPQPSLALSNRAPLVDSWTRKDYGAVVLPSASSAYRSVSYIDVLRGNVPEEVFRDRYVLIGATDSSLSDLYASPAPMQYGLVPGVEIFAAELQGELAGQRIRQASLGQNLLFNLIPIAIVLLGLLWLRPVGVFALLTGVVVTWAGIQAAQPWIGLRFSSAAGLIGLVLVLPLWSLMRLSAAHRFLRRGTQELNTVLVGLNMPNDDHADGDFLDREIDASALAVQRVRDLHRFVRDGVDQLPDATLVLNRRGKVFMANRAAAHHWRKEAWSLEGEDASALLSDIRSRNNGSPMLPPGALCADVPASITGEGEDSEGRIVLLRCVPTFNADNVHAGWMIALVDITRMRRAQSQRDEALRFISHDIREPSASILTVIELARARPAMLPRDLLLQRIERHAQTGLELADGFVNLARAEGQAFQAELLDLRELLTQSIDNAWADSRARDVRVLLSDAPDDATCVGDRGLLSRALTNVLSNALKYSPAGTEVDCSIDDRRTHWALTVRDQGPGIPLEQQSQLFQPFHRLHRESHPGVHGVGLGLLLVRTVAQRHGGTVEIESAAGAGCSVILMVPKPTSSPIKKLGTNQTDSA
ncbi:CHASE2 domain-containing protein [Variovorax dokdonensis]|uniref:histidine kinase n=1 Tax=Variovorax dokdonensis TaxID=344883 RepID=A0ABT7NA49_9BURK|nr:CHASE2 domain-containing protein [Variovorax dokdonensis]MDM0044802.1 CHASE2 domain-containing protein [Variovorax dokdonensis]